MRSPILICILSFFPLLALAQKIIAVDTLTGVTRHIKIGKVLLVSTKDETMERSQLYSYSDSVLAAQYLRKYGRPGISLYNQNGVWRLSAIDNEKKTLTIRTSYSTEDSVRHVVDREFKFEDIRYLTYVRARNPHKFTALRVLSFIFGSSVSILLVVNAVDDDALGDPRPWVAIAAVSWVTFFTTKGLQKPGEYWFRGITN